MPKSLFIVESPAKAKTLSKYLGGGFVVRATVGHIKDLPADSLGVKPDKGFAPSFRVIQGKSKVISAIRSAAQGVDEVYLASDPDREGEAIAWHVAEEIQKEFKGNNCPEFKRVLLHEITKTGLKKALSEAGKLDRDRYESQLARRILDRLVGYELSPLLWKKVSGGLSAGRVQSVAVALVVDREREIQAFVPQEYWVITADLEGVNPPKFQARLIKVDGEKALLPDEATARPLLDHLRTVPWAVLDVQREEKKKYSPPPFITSTLQQDAHRIFRFTTKRTMALAQQLYEGVDMGGMGTHGLITYMRTDSVRVSEEALHAVRGFIDSTFGARYVPSSPNRFRNKKSAQDAHEAIRPTSMEFTPDKVAGYLDKDQARLYGLIWNRFVASQMAPAVFDVTEVTIRAGDRWLFQATGKVLLFDGFLALYRDFESDDDAAGALPPLNPGESLRLLDINGEQRFTQPPSRFTEGTLVKELEKKGIGRPSTYATILSTIQDKQYVERDKGKFAPTELGFVVTDLLRANFPDVMDVGFTAQMEEELDRVEEGAEKREELLEKFWSGFKTALDTARTNMRSVKKEPEKTDVKCPKCGSAMVIRFGRRGAFLACSAFPECRTTMAFERGGDGAPKAVEEVISPEKCELCGANMVLRQGRFGKFWACTTYPKCKGTRPYSTNLPCPREGCGGTLIEKLSKKKTTFHRCSNYPKCDFVSFGRLKPVACTECANPYLEEKGRGKAKSFVCPKCGNQSGAAADVSE